MSKNNYKIDKYYNKYFIAFIIIKCCIIILHGLTINYLYHLDNNCICAIDYRRVYIIISFIIILVYSILTSIPCISKYLANHKILYYSIFLCIIILKVINIVFIFQYIKLLKDRKCECSDSVYKYILYVINIIYIIDISLISIFLFFIILIGIFSFVKIQNIWVANIIWYYYMKISNVIFFINR